MVRRRTVAVLVIALVVCVVPAAASAGGQVGSVATHIYPDYASFSVKYKLVDDTGACTVADPPANCSAYTTGDATLGLVINELSGTMCKHKGGHRICRSAKRQEVFSRSVAGTGSLATVNVRYGQMRLPSCTTWPFQCINYEPVFYLHDPVTGQVVAHKAGPRFNLRCS
jgi:hypothetical protein